MLKTAPKLPNVNATPPGQPPTQGAQPPSQGAQPPSQGGAAPNLPQQALSPQQIHQMQVMAKQAMTVLLQSNTAQHIVQKARAGNPQQVVADLVLTMMERLYEAATKAGQQIDMVTLLVTGIQIIGDLAEMLGAAGVLPKDPQAQAQFVGAVSKICVDRHNQMVQGPGGAPAGAAPPAGAVPPQQPQQGGV